MAAAIETDRLRKSYGSVSAISDIDLEIQRGEVFGYLGPNGAGKTTTIRTLLDFIRPTSGKALVFGLDSREGSRDIKRRVGYLPSDIALYDRMKGEELLRHSAHLRGGVDWPFVLELAERLDMDLSRQIRTLSRGNTQKIGLIQAFMHRPDLIIMDEPSSGLDPLLQQEFYEMVDEVKAEGRTVFISSHILPEVERLCDRVGIIREGRLVKVENVESLKERALHEIEFHFAHPPPADVFTELPGVRGVQVEGSAVLVSVMGSLDAVVKAAARFEVTSVESHEPSLEDIFLSYYGNEQPHVE